MTAKSVKYWCRGHETCGRQKFLFLIIFYMRKYFTNSLQHPPRHKPGAYLCRKIKKSPIPKDRRLMAQPISKRPYFRFSCEFGYD